MEDAQSVLNFWFEELSPADWWKKDESIDRKINHRFKVLHEKARASELWQWRKSPEGRLAEILILDQFSRNLYRDDPQAFAQDPMALALAQACVQDKDDQKLSVERRAFIYLPYMHSESLLVHQEALKLFSSPGLESNYEFEIKHYDIIKRFGRYPHRNKVLGRTSTPEELDFLKGPDSSF